MRGSGSAGEPMNNAAPTIIQDAASTSPELQSISARLALLEMQTSRDFAYTVEVEALSDRVNALEASAPTDADRLSARKSALYLSLIHI
jgi:hypothetical protein